MNLWFKSCVDWKIASSIIGLFVHVSTMLITKFWCIVECSVVINPFGMDQWH
jgi:hypothetical protein